jgi:hypothetical protein
MAIHYAMQRRAIPTRRQPRKGQVVLASSFMVDPGDETEPPA